MPAPNHIEKIADLKKIVHVLEKHREAYELTDQHDGVEIREVLRGRRVGTVHTHYLLQRVNAKLSTKLNIAIFVTVSEVVWVGLARTQELHVFFQLARPCRGFGVGKAVDLNVATNVITPTRVVLLMQLARKQLLVIHRNGTVLGPGFVFV